MSRVRIVLGWVEGDQARLVLFRPRSASHIIGGCALSMLFEKGGKLWIDMPGITFFWVVFEGFIGEYSDTSSATMILAFYLLCT